MHLCIYIYIYWKQNYCRHIYFPYLYNHFQFPKVKIVLFSFHNAGRKGKNGIVFWTRAASWLHSRANLNSLTSVGSPIEKSCMIGRRLWSSNKSFPFFALHPRVMSSSLNSSSKFCHGGWLLHNAICNSNWFRIPTIRSRKLFHDPEDPYRFLSTRYLLGNLVTKTMLLNMCISSLTRYDSVLFSSVIMKLDRVPLLDNERRKVSRVENVKFFRGKSVEANSLRLKYWSSIVYDIFIIDRSAKNKIRKSTSHKNEISFSIFM